MTIQTYFSSLVNSFGDYGKRTEHNNTKAALVDDFADQQLEMTLSRAVLDKRSDGSLRWMAFGSTGYQIYKSEEHLDYHLGQNERVDIWEIEDRRTCQPRTIYKCCDPDDNFTFTSKEELYRESASLSDGGIFRLHDLDTNKKSYIQQKRGWFENSFEEVSLEEARETLQSREETKTLWCRISILGIAVLTTASALGGMGKIFSNNWVDLTTTVSLPSNHFGIALDKTATFVSAALMAYGMSNIGPSQPFPKVLPAVLFGALSWSKPAEAQLCPSFAGSYDTPGTAWGVAVSGSYAYVADRDFGLQIIDVSNKANPTRVGWYDTRGLSYDVVVLGNFAYVADSFRGGLQIIDVSNKANPVLVRSITLGNANGVAVSGNYSYVAAYDTGLQIVDISNKANPTLVGSYNTPGLARGVAVSDNYAYVADQSAGLQIIDVSNKANPTRVGWCDTPGLAYGVAISGNYAYVTDDFSGLQIINVSNKANPLIVSRASTPDLARGVTISGNYTYVASYGSGLQIIDMSDVTNPVRVGFYDTPGYASGVAVFDRYAYVADYDAGLQVIDISCFFSSSSSSSSSITSTTSTSTSTTTASTTTVSTTTSSTSTSRSTTSDLVNPSTKNSSPVSDSVSSGNRIRGILMYG